MKKNTNKLLTAGLVLLLALFVLCAGALKIIPSNIFGYKGSEEEFRTDMERISEDVIEEVSDDYYSLSLKADETVTNYLLDIRGFAGADNGIYPDIDKVKESNGIFSWSKNGDGKNKMAEVEIALSPGPEEMKDVIIAYMIAVNGTLANFTKEQRSYSHSMREYLKVNPDYIDRMNELSSDFKSSDFVKAAELFGNDMFFIDKDENKWIDEVREETLERVYLETKTQSCTKDGYNLQECGPMILSEIDGSVISYGSRTYEEEVHEEFVGPKGRITVPVRYNLSAYRRNELDSIIEWYLNPPIEDELSCISANGSYENGSCSFNMTIDEIWDVLNEQTNIYFDTICNYYGIDTSALWFLESQMYGDLYNGIGGEIIYGSLNYEGEFPYLDYSYDIYGEIDASRSEYGILWGHMADILSSHNKSVGIGQCTGFVFARVYEATGISIPMPDGNKMAAAVADEYEDIYTLSRHPSPGAIGSCLLFNHVFYVEAVTDKGIYVSDGNADYRGSLRINRFYSWSNWALSGLSKAVYAVPNGE